MFVGDDRVQRAYVGSTRVLRAYVGSTRVLRACVCHAAALIREFWRAAKEKPCTYMYLRST